MPQDSPLSITASVTGILTFVVAVVLGFYARALSVREALQTDYRIVEELVQAADNMRETTLLGRPIEESLKHHGGKNQDGLIPLKQMLVDMYILDLRNIISLTVLLKSSRIRRLAEWENKRREVGQRSREASALKAKITHIQMIMLSTKVDGVARGIGDVLMILKQVSNEVLHELHGIRSSLVDRPSIAKPGSQESEGEQPLSPSLGTAAVSPAEENPISPPLEATLEKSLGTQDKAQIQNQSKEQSTTLTFETALDPQELESSEAHRVALPFPPQDPRSLSLFEEAFQLARMESPREIEEYQKTFGPSAVRNMQEVSEMVIRQTLDVLDASSSKAFNMGWELGRKRKITLTSLC